MKFLKVFLEIFLTVLIKLSPILLFLFGLIFLGAWFLSKLEQLSFGNGLYFAWITCTTVGYGDYTPHHPLSKIVCMSLALIGIINTGIITSIALNAVRITYDLHFGKDALKKKYDEQIAHRKNMH